MEPQITDTQALFLARMFKLNLRVIPFPVWKYALEVELEHGPKYGRLLDVTHNDLVDTARIALAHLEEYPDYYQRLNRLEREANAYWGQVTKPPIFQQ